MGLLSDSDIGKKVFDHEGSLLGEITDIGDDGASVRPDPSADEAALRDRGWSLDEEFTLPHDRINRVRADGIHTYPPA